MIFVNLSAIPAPWYSEKEKEVGLERMFREGKDFYMINVENPTYFSIRDLKALYLNGVLTLFLYEDKSMSTGNVMISIKEELDD